MRQSLLNSHKMEVVVVVQQAIDVSQKMLAVLEAKSSTVEGQVADATDLPFGDASFDAVLAVDFFHLVSEWRRAVEEAVRVLRPGGRIVLTETANGSGAGSA